MIGAVELSKRLGLEYPPTDEQAAVIEAPLGPAVVIAGAGSGKTETMAARVTWLVANRLVAPDAVLGLTFTRKAAGELSRRVRRRLAQWRHVLERDAGGDPAATAQLAELLAGEPTVSTYAAYAGRLVAEHAMRVGVEPDARLISPALAWQLADAVSRNHPEALPEDIGAPGSVPRYVLEMSGQFADHLVGVGDVEALCQQALAWFETLPPGRNIRSAYPGDTGKFVDAMRHRLALLPLVRDFAAAKKALPAVDFADQMTRAAEVARLPEVQLSERERFRAVLLDEYQDTGHAQIETLRHLFGVGHPVTAVGDPFQSIYGWRGASSGNIGRFAATFRQADGSPAAVRALATSFRNDELILRAANAVAAPLRSGAASVELRPAAHAGAGALRLARTETVEDEARWIAARMRDAWDALPGGSRTAAVLVRRRSQLPLLADALRAAGLPVEIVGLGGLLTTPEVVDVVATLRVLVQPDAGSALARLLTGARWRVGPRDLAALGARARHLGRLHAPTPPPVQGELFGGAEGAAPEGESPVPPRVPVGLIEALDDLGPAQQYSPDGFARMSALAEELRRLRRRVSSPLAELVADVERAIGVDLEVSARPDRLRVGRIHLDRFLDEASDFAAEGGLRGERAGAAGGSGLTAFLAYLAAAEDEENGLDAGEAVVEAERVQLLTVHGAKGLEWDLVAVPGLVDCVFPAEARSVNWTRTRQELPAALRGDADDLPPLMLADAADRREVRDRLAEHHQAVLARHAEEERRLAYVAFTRARHVLFGSAYVWDTAQKPRQPSPFLADLRAFAEPDEWFEPDPDAANPLTARVRESSWPLDPFGPYPGDSGPGRRRDVEAGAALVRSAAAGTLDAPAPAGVAEQWAADVNRLLAERAALARGDVIEVALPARLSVSQLVELRADPAELARSLRRPVPRAPAPTARRGTAFHTWLEQRWQRQALLDVDELPGAADAGADDAEFDELRAAFEASEWAVRTPLDVEVPFEMTLGGRVVRGRMDAVFGDGDGWIVVDWKTGGRPVGTSAQAAAVQLAAYRLAWARLAGLADTELHRVRAAFHYVRTGETVEPTRLLGPVELRALVEG